MAPLIVYNKDISLMAIETLDLSELMTIEGLPGIKDSDGNELVPFEMPEIKEVQSNPSNRNVDLEKDYEVVRKNVHFQQQLLQHAALKAFENAATSDSPRMMEVFATVMNQMTVNNKQILEIQKQMRDITQEQVTTSQNQQQQPMINATGPVFVGSPAELMQQVGGQIEAKALKRHEGEVIDVN